MTHFSFSWDKNGIVAREYQKNNYKIIETGNDTGKAVVFFSSNGLYYPDTEEAFIDRICKNDRYDWDTVRKFKTIKSSFDKIILVRDLYKSWYVTGINEEINSINKLVEWIKSTVRNYKITCVGSSSGGYAAVLVGALIGAERVLTFSGQFDLHLDDCCDSQLLKLNKDTCEKYYDLIPMVKTNPNVIYYFFPTRSERDIKHYNRVKESGIHIFKIDSDKHGATYDLQTLAYLITAPKGKLDNIEMVCSDSYATSKIIRKTLIPILYRIIDRLKYEAKKLDLRGIVT